MKPDYHGVRCACRDRGGDLAFDAGCHGAGEQDGAYRLGDEVCRQLPSVRNHPDKQEIIG